MFGCVEVQPAAIRCSDVTSRPRHIPSRKNMIRYPVREWMMSSGLMQVPWSPVAERCLSKRVTALNSRWQAAQWAAPVAVQVCPQPPQVITSDTEGCRRPRVPDGEGPCWVAVSDLAASGGRSGVRGETRDCRASTGF